MKPANISGRMFFVAFLVMVAIMTPLFYVVHYKPADIGISEDPALVAHLVKSGIRAMVIAGVMLGLKWALSRRAGMRQAGNA